MRILLDNCVDHRLARMLTGHEVVHAGTLGWAELNNGNLILEAEREQFAVITTTDKRMRHQPRLAGRTICMLVLDTPRITLRHLAPLVPRILEVLDGPRLGEFFVLSDRK